ncbi:MAG TPA: efflux RND transporter periplasmic adaptor subunit [Candidatus Eisenbacteria bacterium]|nr:efflux RND transporter periplasmic adaptor subunit [Candidatus Eisenbacteria bacterium]
MSTPKPRVVDVPPPGDPTPGVGPRFVPSRRRRRLVLGAILLVAAFLAHRLWSAGQAGESDGYVTATVDRGPIDQTVSATGTVNPVKTVQVGTYVSGPIIAIDVDFNSPVTKGQRVAKIDPASFAVKVRQSEANVANAVAKVQKDRADLALKKLLLDRNRTLLARELIAQNDLDTSQSNYDQALAQLALDEAAVKQAQASLEEAQVNLGYTEILSPVDGVVVSRNVDVGQTVAASFQTPTLFLIAEDLTKMQVDTNVSESDVGRTQVGQPATFTVDAYPGIPFHGVVSQVRNAPITVQNVVTYDVVLAVDNAGMELKPGMTANVSITTAHRDDVLRVPTRAFRFRTEQGGAPERSKQGKTTVQVVGPGETLRPVEIKAGIRDAQFAEVLGGDLHEGDVVAIGVRREESAAAPPAQPPGFAGARRRF